MKKIIMLIVVCTLCLSMTVMTGCGSKQGAENDSNQNEAVEEDIEEEEYHEPNPYIDGMTLEDAKFNIDQYGTMFIKRGDLFYPLVESKRLCESGPTGAGAENPGSVYIINADDEGLIQTLGKDDQLVEVETEKEGYFEPLTGRQGYTTDETVYFRGYEDGTYELYENDSLDVTWEKIDAEEPDLTGLAAFAKDVFDNDSELDEYVEHLKEMNYADFNTGMIKMANWKHGYVGQYIGCECILDLEKGQTVTVQTREEGSVDIVEEEYIANYKYLNMPEQLGEEEESTYDYTYSQTEYGYSILDTDNLPPGQYVCNTSMMFSNPPVFIKQ